MSFLLPSCRRLVKFRIPIGLPCLAESVRHNVIFPKKYSVFRHRPKPFTNNSSTLGYGVICGTFPILVWLGLEKTEDEDELILALKRSVLLMNRSEYAKAERMLHLALRMAQQVQNQLAITYIHDLMANVALSRNELDKSEKLFINVSQRLLVSGVVEDDLRMVHISLKLARIRHLQTDFAAAQIGYEWCIDKLETKSKFDNNPDVVKLLALAKNWYGHLLNDGGKLKDGLNYLLESYLMYLSFEDRQEDQIVIQLNDIATTYMKLDDYENCEKYLLEAIDRGKPLTNMDYYGAVYVNLGRLHTKKQNYELARQRCGMGWRLGYERKNQEVMDEGMACIKQIAKLTNTI